MASTIFGTNLCRETCCTCGMEFAMPADITQRRRDDHDWFYCPAGHQQHYMGETEASRLRRELAQVKRDAEANSAYLNSRLAAEKASAHGAAVRMGLAQAKLRRAMKRVGAGVCPCCNRTFKQLAAHMKCKHPEPSR